MVKAMVKTKQPKNASPKYSSPIEASCAANAFNLKVVGSDFRMFGEIMKKMESKKERPTKVNNEKKERTEKKATSGTGKGVTEMVECRNISPQEYFNEIGGDITKAKPQWIELRGKATLRILMEVPGKTCKDGHRGEPYLRWVSPNGKYKDKVHSAPR